MFPGRTAAPTNTGTGQTIPGDPKPFKGLDFPTFIHRGKEKSAVATIAVPQGDIARVSFHTDVKNNYFTRRKPPRGTIVFQGTLPDASYRLINGRLTVTCRVDKKLPIGTELSTLITITDQRGSGPFVLRIDATVVAARQPGPRNPRVPQEPRVQAAPSQPDVEEQDLGPDAPPAKIEKHPETGRLKIVINKTSKLLADAKAARSAAEEPAVSFVFKYGLALSIMGMLDSVKNTQEWEDDNVACRERIEGMAVGIARVIVPLCLSLPKNLPKPMAA